MGIADDDVQRVRDASDLREIASQYLSLRRVGTRWMACCPFHGEKTPSLSINDQLGLWYCFGCQAKGDVITFVREIEHLDFVGAVEHLAAKAGITLTYTDRNEGESRKRRSLLVETMRKAVDWYHQRLLVSADGGTARGYLRSRGYDGAVARTYQLGWAPDDWDALAKALHVPDDVLRDTGLGFVNRRGRQQDSFRSRVMFPIFDANGDPVAFGGRVLPGADGPKYKNSPETEIYRKSRVLYALNWAKTDVVQAGEVIICEGYTDVIGFGQAGLARAVATCGTAMTEEHVRLLKRFANRVVLAFDADSAGQAAAERVYQWERDHEMEFFVAALPKGDDPGDLARHDPEALVKAVEQATPFLGFRVERVLASANLQTPEGRARAAEAALAVIREHPNELVRDQYLMEVAGRCRLEPDRLREQLADPRRSPAVEEIRLRRPEIERDGPELEGLRQLVQRPDEMAPWLHECLFSSELHAAAYRALIDSANLHEALENADPEAIALLQRVAVEETDATPVDVATELVRGATRRMLASLGEAARHSDDPVSYSPAVSWLKHQMELLNESRTAPEAVGRLLPWLAQRYEER